MYTFFGALAPGIPEKRKWVNFMGKGDPGTVLILGGRAPRKAVCGRRQSSDGARWLFWAEEGQCSPLSCPRVREPSLDTPSLRHSAGMPQGELRRHAQTVLSVLASGEAGWGRTACRRLQSPESQQSRHKVHTMQRTSLLPKACPPEGSPENTAPQKPHL